MIYFFKQPNELLSRLDYAKHLPTKNQTKNSPRSIYDTRLNHRYR